MIENALEGLARALTRQTQQGIREQLLGLLPNRSPVQERASRGGERVSVSV